MSKKKRNDEEEKTEVKEEETPSGLSQEDLIESIVKRVDGAELLDRQTLLAQGFISTTNLALNYLCSGKFLDGGIPKGRVTQIHGPSSSAKTVLGTHILQGCQKANGIPVLLDAESAYSPAFGATLGMDPSKLVYLQPEHLEACFKKTEEIAMLVAKKGNKQPVCVVYDSIAASPSAKEFNDMMEGNSSGPEMGERARICSRELRKISSFLNRLNCAFVVINQIRMKIGVMYGNPETTAGGGNSLEYYCSVILDCRRRKTIMDAKKRIAGIMIDVKCVKNKITVPFRVAKNLRLYWNYGLDPCSGLLDLLIESDRLEPGSPGWYHLASDKSVKFQAKREDNYVPPQFLVDHPEVIDATRDQVESFLGQNRSAIDASSQEGLEVEDEDGTEGEKPE